MRSMIMKASSSTGSADMMSTIRMMKKSVRPPYQPASAPMGSPTARANTCDRIAMLSETRVA